MATSDSAAPKIPSLLTRMAQAIMPPAPAPIQQGSSAPAPAPIAAPAPSPAPDLSTFWDTPTVDANARVNVTADSIYKNAKIEDMLKSARNVNFTAGIPKEVLTKITAGGPEAAEAFMTALNDVGSRIYAQSSFAASQFVRNGLTAYDGGLTERLPSHVRDVSTRDAIGAALPVSLNPALAPIVDAYRQQALTKYPSASPAEITELVEYMVTEAGKAFSPAPPAPKPTSADTNWAASGYFK